METWWSIQIVHVDSWGNKELAYALICSVYGIGKTTAFKICVDTALDPHKCLGSNQFLFKRILEKGCNSVPLLIVVVFLKWLLWTWWSVLWLREFVWILPCVMLVHMGNSGFPEGPRCYVFTIDWGPYQNPRQKSFQNSGSRVGNLQT